MNISIQNSGSRLRNGLIAALTALFIFVSLFSTFGEGIKIGTNTAVSFASAAEGREVLMRRDEFIAALTPIDRRARLHSEREVSEKDFLAFVSRSVQAWTPAETNRLATAFRIAGATLDHWRLPWPETILLIRTSGEEEFANCYTRQNAIVIPTAEVAGPPAALNYLVLHELFHVLSRHDPQLRQTLYGLIGFRPINEIELPEELLRRKITNPDGVQNGWVISLTNRNEVVQAVPVLQAKGDSFNPNERGASPYDYFRLLVVKPDPGGWAAQRVAGSPRLLQVADVTGWSEQIGRNTGYIIHPDEILADNFVRLVNGDTNLPTPRIVTDMANAFKQRASKP